MSKFRADAIVFVIIFVASLGTYRSASFVDPGTFWHTRFGEIMLEQRAIIEVDSFTKPFEGQPWRPQQWLSEIVMALLYRAGGWDAQLLAFCTLLAGMYSWACARMREAGMPLILAFMAVMTVWLGAYFHAFVRPHMVTILLTGWTLARLIDFDRGRIGLGGLAWLIPVNILWTNLHGGVIGGLMMHAICGAWWLLMFLVKRSSPIRSGREAVWFCVISILAALAPIVNPYGVGMFQIWTKIVGSKAMKEFVLEHQALNWRDGAGQWVLGVSIAYLVFLLTAIIRVRRVRITWLMPALWFALSFTGIRHGPLAMITGLIALADVWPHSIGYFLTIAKPVPVSRRWLLASLGVVIVFFAVQPWRWIRPWARHGDDAWPMSILPELNEVVSKVPAGSTIYNDPYFGGYLIWYAPSLKIFMDDRFELCGDDWLRKYCTSSTDDFDEWDRQYGFRLVLIQTSTDEPTMIDRYLTGKPEQWRVVARHKVAVLFEKIQ